MKVKDKEYSKVQSMLNILEDQVLDVELKVNISIKQLSDLVDGKPAYIQIKGETYGIIRKQALEMIIRQQRMNPNPKEPTPKKPKGKDRGKMIAINAIQTNGVLSIQALRGLLEESGYTKSSSCSYSSRIFQELEKEEHYHSWKEKGKKYIQLKRG